MDKFLRKNAICEKEAISESNEVRSKDDAQQCLKQPRIEINLEDLPTDPGLRPKVTSYNTNDRDKVRRYYLQKGPCLACLNPDNSFIAFDKQRLIEFAKFYPNDFSPVDLVVLGNQLEIYILDMRSNDEFSELKGTGNLAEMLVKTGKDRVYQLVYTLIKLALTLPVATATVERAFSAMKIVKNRLRNRMEDDWLNDCLVTYIERDVFHDVDNELIIQRFQTMSSRRGQL